MDRDMPIRIQRKRTKGWRMPADTVYVGRPSRWGNPTDWIDFIDWLELDLDVRDRNARKAATVHFRHWIGRQLMTGNLILADLEGKDLACWCPLDQPCHADILLEIANEK